MNLMKNLKAEIQSAVNVYKSGDLAKAEILSKKLIQDNPKIVFLYNLLGLVLTEQKKIDEAIRCYEDGIKIDPDFAMNYNNLAQLYVNHKFEKLSEKAENLYKKSISLDGNIPEPHNNLGNLYSTINKNDEAIKCFKKAISINSEFFYAFYNLGRVLISVGKISEAKTNLKKAIELNPDFYHAHRLLSRATKYKSDDKHFLQLERIYKKTTSADIEKKISLGFALGKAYEDTKNFKDSFLCYKEANQLHRSKINFSIDTEREKFSRIKKLFNKKFINKNLKNGYQNSSSIFIVGMPRSGTTLVEQIISSHPKVFGADEVNFIPRLAEENLSDLYSNTTINSNNEIGKQYINEMKNINNDAEKYTDKLPINFMWLGFIKIILPNSKIIHCSRNPRDNCFSIFKNYFTNGKLNFAYDVVEIVDFYNLYHNLMQHWNNLLPNFIYNLRYEDLISDTEKEIKKLIKVCDLDWHDDCLKFYNNKRSIKTASDIQARTKIYNSSINSWKKFKNELKDYFAKLKN